MLRADKYTGGDMKVLRADIPQQPMGIVAVANDTNSCEFYFYLCFLGSVLNGIAKERCASFSLSVIVYFCFIQHNVYLLISNLTKN